MKIVIGGKTFEISKEELEKNPDEIKIDFDGLLRTKAEEDSFIENHKIDARKEGEELSVKKYREEYGFSGRSIDKLIDAVKAKTLEESKAEPNEQIKKLQTTLADKETALQAAIAKATDVETNFLSYKNQSKIDQTIDSLIPVNTVLPKEDMKLILKNKLSFDISENGNVVVKDQMGNVIKNQTTADAMAASDIVSDFFKTNQSYLKGIEGGRGHGDSGSASKKQSIDEFINEQAEKGVSPNSKDFNDELNKRIKDGSIDA